MTKDSRFHIPAGMLLGFSQYFYVAARLIPVVMVCAFAVLAFKKIRFKKLVSMGAIILIFSLLIYAPQIYYYIKIPSEFFIRIDQVGILSSNWFLHEHGVWPFLLHGADAFSVYFVNDHPSLYQYGAERYLPLLASFLFLIGFYTSFFRKNKREVFIVLFWVIGGTILAGVLTSNIVASRYIILLPAVCIFMGIGVDHYYTLIRADKVPLRRTMFAGLLVYYALQNSYSYIYYETRTAFTFDINTQIASYAGRYLMSQKEPYTLYFLGSAYYNYQFFGFNYPAYQPVYDLPFPISSYALSLTGRDIFIILPPRHNDLLLLQKANPSGIHSAVTNPTGDILFYLFTVRKA
jgi:hypothetical protein